MYTRGADSEEVTVNGAQRLPKYQRYWVLSLGIVSGGLTIAMWGLQIHVQLRAHRLRVRPRAHLTGQLRAARSDCVSLSLGLLTDRCVRLTLTLYNGPAVLVGRSWVIPM